MKISIKNIYKSIPAGLEINDLPEFVIITGENGSGKSQLLEYIRSNGTNNTHANFINWIPSDWKAASPMQGKQNRQQYEKQITSINQSLIDSFRQLNTKQQANHPHEPYFAEIAYKLEKNINELTEQEIIQNMPYDVQNKLLVEADFIRLFIAYRNSYDSRCGSANEKGNDSELKKLRTIKAPWVLINELFKSYDFEYRLQEPPGKGHEFTSLVFYHYQNTSLKLGLNDLSSGEQIITMLILWSHNPNTGSRYKLLLLDGPVLRFVR